MLKLPASASDVLLNVLVPAMELLPDEMDTPQARVQMLATGGQESGFATRRQYGDGPARGLWQFEQGTPASKGGIWGVYLFQSTAGILHDVCDALHIPFDAVSIYNNLETNDLLAACVARIMLYTDPKPLPDVTDVEGSWLTYLRIWKPGKPRPQDWAGNHSRAVETFE
jgi:hypothetical protein